MSGICKYCGYSGTNEMMMEHAGSCDIMNYDYSPEDCKLGEMKMKKGFTTVVVGALWGDEGKGKIAAYLAYHDDYDIAVRAGTGTNAGHSIYRNDKMYKTNQLPIAGMFPNKSGKKMTLAIGSGVCVDPKKLYAEIDRFDLHDRDKIVIDRLCPVITPEHIEKESTGANYSESHTGSTKSGTGEARVDRVKRTGPLYAEYLEELHEEHYICGIMDYSVYGNVAKLLNEAYDSGAKIVVEGSQAYCLSLYLSDGYPVVTSDNCTTAAFIDDVGLAWNRVDEVCMVIKSAPTMVAQGCGNLPGEISKEEMHDKGLEEYGVTSGRLRRKSLTIPFDKLDESVMVNGPTYFALSFCDHIDEIPEIMQEKMTREWLSMNMPNTFANVTEIEGRYNIPVRFIEYGKDFFAVSELENGEC